ncbi:non-hemolytic enterotoxin subunit B [Bacillus pseudomycoides]|uniref:non-hemolytic enterotoxin subunit B n=2 Tax=Bacillus pseudomycoides TaxID=64104 RepID=UPI0004EDA338|nr:HBL/NHE enterotoxin family protein [Bacillus pseudomycoides]AIK38429.1 hemolytic enterotoxin family protein [Bacillus pseudomycoides]AJI16202.1 hemolytic enterotoxin family protein [Bacillus pseudomycoides]PEB42352.1 enterotoxin [Bacillus pseudomycoides]PEE06042.1 enterotoxin [Bacillus pseudomycoides]PEM74706.1 enterotoxin [Bacillus pseudomycoides]
MKKPYKVMALSTLIATIAAGSITPSYVSAAENTTKSAPIYAGAENNSPEYSLGPEGLKDALEKTGSNMLVMDLYALTIVKQANVNFDGLTVINNDLQKSIKDNHDASKKNANQWLDGLKPQIIQTNQNIINYNTQFQNYYDVLVEAVNNNDKETLKAVLTSLDDSISENKGAVDRLVQDLKAFRGKLELDTQNLKTDANKITDILSGQDAGIPLMQKQIETNQTLIDENNKVYIGSSVATALGAYLTATVIFAPIGAGALGGGIYGVVTSQQQIKKAQEEIKNLTENISTAKQQVAKLTILKNNTNNLTETIDAAITALENVKNQWQTMGAKYKSLNDNVDRINPDKLATIIKVDLKIAKGSWEQVNKYAENIQKAEISFVEEKK